MTSSTRAKRCATIDRFPNERTNAALMSAVLHWAARAQRDFAPQNANLCHCFAARLQWEYYFLLVAPERLAARQRAANRRRSLHFALQHFALQHFAFERSAFERRARFWNCSSCEDFGLQIEYSIRSGRAFSRFVVRVCQAVFAKMFCFRCQVCSLRARWFRARRAHLKTWLCSVRATVKAASTP